MIFNLMQGLPSIPSLRFTVNGVTHTATGTNVDESGIWKVRYESTRTLVWLRTSGTLAQVVKPVSASVFLCGPGADGQAGYADQYSGGGWHGGKGGNGGERKTDTLSLSRSASFSVTVNTSTTSIGSLSASKGGGSSGGNGGFSNQDGQGADGSAGSNGAYAWGNSAIDGILYGAGGGGGTGAYYDRYVSGPWNGGATGGARGTDNLGNISTAIANTGGGGGGGTHKCVTTYNPSAGATGIVILNIPR